jgi:alkylhydroperoxidase family enzyme
MREIVVLRTCFRCCSGYEWSHHAVSARAAGLSDAEIAALKSGEGRASWTEAEQHLIEACDQLVADYHVREASWNALRQVLSERQLMDLVLTVGQYTQMSMVTNTFGVRFDPVVPADEGIAKYEDG